MPYQISDSAEGCSGWATVKEDGEVMGCHETKQDAINQALAIAEAEGSEYIGERARVATDVFTTEQEAKDRADELGCEGTHTMTLDGDTVYMPCSTHGRYEEATGQEGYRSTHDEGASTPAPKSEQIKGSKKNKEGSASGPGNKIKLSERVETALKNKVRDHNQAMKDENKPEWTRTTLGQLRAVYRRGAGAYSSSHRPGMTRGAWAMARVNAYLYLLRNGKPKNKNYVTDNDLLPKEHPKSTRSHLATERRDVDLSPPAYMRAAARQGLNYHEEGLSGSGLRPQTVREARAMAEGNVTADKWVRLVAWIARHMGDLDADAADPDHEDYPSPGVVAHLLWGSGPSKRAAERALAYARGVVGRLEQENADRATGKVVAEIETRTHPSDFEVRETSEGMTFEGYAAMFDSPSQPLPFTEKIAPGAFQRSLKARNDIKLLWNHSTGEVLGSTKNGTLKLTEDERGLKVWSMLPNTTTGRDAAELIRRGDVDAMSFGFSVPNNGDSWSEDGQERTLNEVRLHEVSIVAFPAYTATTGTTSVRGLDRLAERAEVDQDQLADALLKVEMGDDITEDDKNLLERVLSKLAPETEQEAEADNSLELLQLKKQKLKLLMGL